MYSMQELVVKNNHEKSGTQTSGKAWCRHAYQFEMVDGWFARFVKPGTPIYPKGTVFKKMTYEDDGTNKNIKEIIVGSVPGEHKQGASKGKASKPQSIESWLNSKDHAIWFCVSYAKDLEVARVSHLLFPTGTAGKKKDELIPGLRQLATNVALEGVHMFYEIADALKRGRDGLGEDNEPPQEPDMPPPGPDEPPEPPEPVDGPDDDIPF